MKNISYQVPAPLLNEFLGQLEQLPAFRVRHMLNALEALVTTQDAQREQEEAVLKSDGKSKEAN